MPVQQEPVLPPPSVRDRVVEGLQWPGGVQLDPGMLQEPPPGTSTDVLEEEIRPFRRQEIGTTRKKRRPRLTDV